MVIKTIIKKQTKYSIYGFLVISASDDQHKNKFDDVLIIYDCKHIKQIIVFINLCNL